MNEKQKKEILLKFGVFFKEKIAHNHLANLKKLRKFSAFDNNPFLIEYLSIFLSGKSDSESVAKALIYPRILGTSINTSFGANLQNVAPEIFKSVLGSTTSGIDVEFIDSVDGRKKYCQIKLGPNTINKDDVATISGHFTAVKNLARTNNLPLQLNDLIVGVLYGEANQLSANYRNLKKEHPVYVGKEFWYRLTGDETFYASLIETFGNAAKETKAKRLLDKVIKDLAEDIKIHFVQEQLEK